MAILQDKVDELVDYIGSWRQENSIDGNVLLTDDQLAKLTRNIINFTLKI